MRQIALISGEIVTVKVYPKDDFFIFFRISKSVIMGVVNIIHDKLTYVFRDYGDGIYQYVADISINIEDERRTRISMISSADHENTELDAKEAIKYAKEIIRQEGKMNRLYIVAVHPEDQNSE